MASFAANPNDLFVAYDDPKPEPSGLARESLRAVDSGKHPRHMTSGEYVNPSPKPEHRVRQSAPEDLVQQQSRLLALALRDLSSAISISDRKHMHGGRSIGSQTEAAAGAINEIARLGGWAESLLPVGVPVHIADNKVVIFDRIEGEEAPFAE